MWTNDGRILMFYAVLLRSTLQWMMWCWDWTCWLLTAAWATGGFKTSTLNILNQASVNGSFQYWERPWQRGSSRIQQSHCANCHDYPIPMTPWTPFTPCWALCVCARCSTSLKDLSAGGLAWWPNIFLGLGTAWQWMWCEKLPPKKKTLNNNYNYI